MRCACPALRRALGRPAEPQPAAADGAAARERAHITRGQVHSGEWRGWCELTVTTVLLCSRRALRRLERGSRRRQLIDRALAPVSLPASNCWSLRLPRLQRARPSTALDKRVVVAGECATPPGHRQGSHPGRPTVQRQQRWPNRTLTVTSDCVATRSGQTSTMNDRLALVTGASGYIGGRLVPHLLAAGFRVRCLARNTAKLRDQPWRDGVEVVQGDAAKSEDVERAGKGAELAYYLVHSIGSGRRFESTDRDTASSFARGAESAGIRRDHLPGRPLSRAGMTFPRTSNRDGKSVRSCWLRVFLPWSCRRPSSSDQGRLRSRCCDISLSGCPSWSLRDGSRRVCSPSPFVTCFATS